MDEVPFAKAALEEFSLRIEKRMEEIHDHFMEYKRLRRRLDLAQRRLEKQGQSKVSGYSNHREETGEFQ